MLRLATKFSDIKRAKKEHLIRLSKHKNIVGTSKIRQGSSRVKDNFNLIENHL
jgi:hypothetical protein